MKNTTLYINGRFLGKPTAGTQRFAREIVWALDKQWEEIGKGREAIILAPAGVKAPDDLRFIKFQTCGRNQGHVWEQLDLWLASRKGALLSLTNSGPVFHPNHLVVIHDALVYRLPKSVPFLYRLFHSPLGRILGRFAKVATVSFFSQKELADVFHLDPQRIPVVPNGHEHILDMEPDDEVLKKNGLLGKRFFLFVGSPALNKNMKRALDAFKALRREDISFVVVGAAGASFFESNERPPNVLTTGRLSDNELVSLYRYALALVFPSLYEGFGIPPLEAMVHGCPVLASDIPPVREVCGEAALFFSPLDVKKISEHMEEILESDSLRMALAEKGRARCKLFSWEKSTRSLSETLATIGA